MPAQIDGGALCRPIDLRNFEIAGLADKFIGTPAGWLRQLQKIEEFYRNRYREQGDKK